MTEPQSNIISLLLHKAANTGVTKDQFHIIMSDCLFDFGNGLLRDYFKIYRANKKAFINQFVKYDSIKYACCFALNFANRRLESECMKYLEEHGTPPISEYVSGLHLTDRYKEVLVRVLKIFFVIGK